MHSLRLPFFRTISLLEFAPPAGQDAVPDWRSSNEWHNKFLTGSCKTYPEYCSFRPVDASSNGRNFAIDFEHEPWLTHLMLDVMQLDMAFQGDEYFLFVWDRSVLTPIARIDLGSGGRALCLSREARPRIAYVDGNTLRVIRLQ